MAGTLFNRKPGSQHYPCIVRFFGALAKRTKSLINFVTKGSNSFTEHYSGVRAEVVHHEDHTTGLNEELIETLEVADEIWIAGEASSHCVKSTIEDILKSFSDPRYVRKLVFIQDCSSPVTGFEKNEEDFIREACAVGMRVSTSEVYLT